MLSKNALLLIASIFFLACGKEEALDCPAASYSDPDNDHCQTMVGTWRWRLPDAPDVAYRYLSIDNEAETWNIMWGAANCPQGTTVSSEKPVVAVEGIDWSWLKQLTCGGIDSIDENGYEHPVYYSASYVVTGHYIGYGKMTVTYEGSTYTATRYGEEPNDAPEK